MISKQCSLS